MRTVTLLILVLLAAVATLVFVRPASVDGAQRHHDDIAEVRTSLTTIRRHVLLHATLNQESHRVRGHPERIDPAWFGDERPTNPWFGENRPWVEIAPVNRPASRANRPHPPCIVALEPTDGTFWYDPRSGVVRARVPAGLMDDEAIALYNAANGTDVHSILP